MRGTVTEIPACAGMTIRGAGMTIRGTGMTIRGTGMTIRGAGMTMRGEGMTTPFCHPREACSRML